MAETFRDTANRLKDTFISVSALQKRNMYFFLELNSFYYELFATIGRGVRRGRAHFFIRTSLEWYQRCLLCARIQSD